MRKAFIVLTGILFTLLFATCKQFTADIDDYLSRWSSEAFIQSSTIDNKTYNDGSSIPSVASANDVIITLKVQNPKSFWFVIPSASETRKIVEFAHFAGTKPVAGTDYELIQRSADTLKLVYKKSFLEKAEWGEKDISSTITLYADDGRPPFKQTFTIPLKANTPPPKPGYAVAKTTGTTAYYVLCITVPDMDKTAGGGLLHKDLACIEVNGTPYTFSVDEGQHKFTKPESPFFITHSDVEKLSNQPNDAIPTDSSWVLYYETDVKVELGAAKKDYTIKLIDKKGLASDIVNASTKPNKPEAEEITITEGTKSSGNGGSESDPTIIGTDSSGATLSVSSATANTTVHCTLTEIGSSTPAKYDGNPVTVPLPLNGAGEKKYKLEYYTDGEGFAATPVKTIYYKVVKTYTVTFRVTGGNGTIKARPEGGSENTTGSVSVEHGKKVTFTAAPARGWHIDSWTVSTGNFESGGGTGTSATLKVTAEATVTVKFEPDAAFNLASSETGAWKILREEAARTKGPGTIVIDGTITATGGDNAGEITLGRSLTIEGKSGSSTDILDAAGLNRIFKVSSGTLTLKNLTLKNGKAEGSDGPGDGGAIYVHGASVKITGCTLTDNTANKNGGAVYATKRGDNAAHVTISGGSINGNTVTINSGFGGGIYINDGCELTLKDNVTVKDNKAARGGGVRANKSTVTMNGCTFEGNKSTHGDASNGCGGVYVNGGTVTMQSCTLKSNDGKVRAGGLLVEGGAKVTMDGCTITGNTATTGGGIYITGGSSIVTLNNGVQIKDNTATTGGGVYVQDGTFKMSGSAIVTPSTGSDQYTPGKNDVYLKTGQAITVDGTLSNNPAARITPEEYKENVPVLRGNITDGSPQNRKKFTVPPEKVTEDSENWNVFWYIADNGNLKAEVEDPDMLKTVTDGSPNNTIIKLGNISDLKTVEIWGYRKIMLKADRAVTLTCSSKGNNYKHLQVQEHASLILKGPITLQGADYGGNTQYALYVENGGKAEIKDGVTITGFKNGNIGPVVSDGKLTMSGGEISGNKAKNGGGVYIHASWRSFKMTGGTIKGNLATEHGGGVYVDGSYNNGYPIRGQFWLEGGTIEGNTADKGGGVYSQGKFTMKGGTITKNTATDNGKAIMLNYYFHWEGGEIKDNRGKGSVVGDSGGNFSNDTNPRKEPS